MPNLLKVYIWRVAENHFSFNRRASGSGRNVCSKLLAAVSRIAAILSNDHGPNRTFDKDAAYGGLRPTTRAAPGLQRAPDPDALRH